MVKLEVRQVVASGDPPGAGQHLRRRNSANRAEPGKRPEELVVAADGVAADAMGPPPHRERIDQPVMRKLVGRAQLVQRRAGRAGRRDDRPGRRIDAIAPRSAPADEILGISPAAKMVVQVAALGHRVEKHPQLRRALADLLEPRSDSRFARGIERQRMSQRCPARRGDGQQSRRAGTGVEQPALAGALAVKGNKTVRRAGNRWAWRTRCCAFNPPQNDCHALRPHRYNCDGLGVGT